MDDYFNMPFAMIGEGKIDSPDPGTFATGYPNFNLPAIKNYAENQEVRAWFKKEIYLTMEWTRINRINLEEEWRAIRRQRVQQHDTNRKYYGRSDAYIPLYARVETTLAEAIVRGLFPTDEYMDAVESDTGDPEAAKPAKAYMKWELEKNARIRMFAKKYVIQLIAWGNSPLKAWYGMEFRREARNQAMKHFGSNYNQPQFKLKCLREGLRLSVRSLLYWYMYPPTADSLEDATIVFEDIQVPIGYIKDLCHKGIWKNEQAALHAPIPTNFLVNQQDQLTNSYGITPPAAGIMGEHDLGGTRVLTEGYAFAPLPSDAYTEEEETWELLPIHFVAAGTDLLWFSRNENWHQRSPYLVARRNVEPGFFYGHGEGRRIRPLQYLVNDFANQGNDVGIYGIQGVNKVNPAYVAGPLPPMKPGVVWKMMDIEQGHKFDRPPTEGAQFAMEQLTMYMGMGQEFSGSPPSSQGGIGKLAKTATAAAIQSKNVQNPLQGQVEDIEIEVLGPLMELAWINAQQFRDKAVMTKVAGAPFLVTPEMLAGEYDFTWTASTQTQNQNQRAQQLLQFLQAAAPFIQLLNQQGKTLDPEPILKKVWTDGLGQRGFEQIIIQAIQPANPGGAQPATPQQAHAEQGQKIRSALEQAYGADETPTDMQPGEGEDFADVRQQADQEAANAGANYGQ